MRDWLYERFPEGHFAVFTMNLGLPFRHLLQVVASAIH